MKRKLSTFLALLFVIVSLSSWSREAGSNPSNTRGWYTCDRCNGSGHDPQVLCRTCKGNGTVTENRICRNRCNSGKVRDNYGNIVNCPLCGGTGKEPMSFSCSSCGGWGHASCMKCKGSKRQWRD